MPAGGSRYCQDVCRPQYKRRAQETPCGGCRNNPGDLDPANAAAMRCWPMVQSFWITGGMGDPIGWDAEKAAAYLERLGLYSLDTITRLTVYAEAALEGLAQRRKAERAQQEALAQAKRR